MSTKASEETLRKMRKLLRDLPRTWEITTIALTGRYLGQLAMLLGKRHDVVVGFLIQCSDAIAQYVVEYDILSRKRPALKVLPPADAEQAYLAATTPPDKDTTEKEHTS